MEAKELRIGNLITDKWSKGKYPFTILSLGKSKCTYFGHQQFWAKYENLEPIPLTEEWLLKFGFKERKNSIRYRYYKNRHSIELFSNYARMNYSIGFKYVHQLQNLYFALYGEELTIKEIKQE